MSKYTPKFCRLQIELSLVEFSSSRFQKFPSKFVLNFIFKVEHIRNNAGTYARKFELSEDGMEKIFATNHIGPFLLTNLLLDKMEITAKETNKEGHIVIVSSSAHFWALKEGITFDKLNEKTRYAQSKLASILYVKELSRHLQEKGSNVMANALHPGAIRTKLVNESMGLFMRYLLFILLGPFWKTIPQQRHVMWPQALC
ncbi:hypothetical protein CY35_12G082000 [Sphagnum magellanicum]|nr:hypothetical protein CY35_12G082000 [Sphagnum magellanicum]